MKKTVVVLARDLEVGSVIAPDMKVTEIAPCSKRDHLHINKKDCYWELGRVSVKV